MICEDIIKKESSYLFDEFSSLKSFSWVQWLDENDNLIVESDDFTINEESYWGENSIWKGDVSNYLKNIFDELPAEDLQELYGNNVKVIITRNETIVDPYSAM